jgi:hypothetical protein
MLHREGGENCSSNASANHKNACNYIPDGTVYSHHSEKLNSHGKADSFQILINILEPDWICHYFLLGIAVT